MIKNNSIITFKFYLSCNLINKFNYIMNCNSIVSILNNYNAIFISLFIVKAFFRLLIKLFTFSFFYSLKIRQLTILFSLAFFANIAFKFIKIKINVLITLTSKVILLDVLIFKFGNYYYYCYWYCYFKSFGFLASFYCSYSFH